MRILHVNEIAQFKGGVERILVDTARGFAAQGIDQALLYEDSQADLRILDAFQDSGTQLDIIERFKPDIALVHKASLQCVSQLRERVNTVRMVHDHDLVCLRKHKYFPLSKQVCELPAGVRCLTHLCAIQPNRGVGVLPVRLASLKDQLAIIREHKRLTKLIVGSEWMRNSLLANGFAQEQLVVIPPIPSSLESVKALPLGETGRELLYVGQLLRGKGIDLMLAAFARLEGEWRARIVGEGNFRAKAQDLVKSLGLDDRVEFTGWIDHESLDQFYQQSRALVVPSRWPEPFGMVGVEAMARARPVVGFAVGGIPDWLKDGESGILANAGSVAQLAQGMQRILDDPVLATDLGLGGLKAYQQNFQHSRYLKQLYHLLKEAS